MSIICYLLCIDAIKSVEEKDSGDRKKKVAKLYVQKAKCRIQSNLEYIVNDDQSYIKSYKEII